MIFHEVYGKYYYAVAKVLDQAREKPLTYEDIQKIIREQVFEEGVISIADEISYGKSWSLLNEQGKSIMQKETHMPVTLLEKRWMKSLLLDPRIQLFQPDPEGLEEIEPLFRLEDIVFFDQFSDGDPYQEEKYIHIFRSLLSAVKGQRTVKVKYLLKNGSSKWITCNPVRIEYSQRDDKFRLISVVRSKVRILKIAKIEECQILERFADKERNIPLHEKREIELLLHDEHQALKRVLLQFSIYKKETQKAGTNQYRVKVAYEKEDEMEILIKILSFGPNLKVTGPETFVNMIKRRIRMQKGCGY